MRVPILVAVLVILPTLVGEQEPVETEIWLNESSVEVSVPFWATDAIHMAFEIEGLSELSPISISLFSAAESRLIGSLQEAATRAGIPVVEYLTDPSLQTGLIRLGFKMSTGSLLSGVCSEVFTFVSAQNPMVQIEVDPETKSSDVEKLQRVLSEAGFQRIQIRRSPTGGDGEFSRGPEGRVSRDFS